MNRDAHDAAAQVADLLERRTGIGQQTDVVLEHLNLRGVGHRLGRRMDEAYRERAERSEDWQPGSGRETHC